MTSPAESPVDFIRERLVYEDNHLIIVVKPFNMPSQGDATGDTSLLDVVREYIRKVYQKPGNVYLALLHRLDRPVGGLMVFAKTGKAAGRMGKLFKEQQVQKEYLAIVEGLPPQNRTLHHYLKKLPGKNIVRASNQPRPDYKEAELSFTLKQQSKELSLLLVKPKTGRSHQIRVQLATEGFPIAGDKKYGSRKSTPDRSLALFSCYLSFQHPVKEMSIEYRINPPRVHYWKDFQ